MVNINVQGLSKRFNREWIFKNLNYNFSTGNTYAITGPNGSGKSTLLQVLWGQMPPTAGTMNFSNQQQAIAIEDVYKHISVATPYMDLIDEFTLIEQLQFHFKLKLIRNGMSLDSLIDIMYLENSRDKQITYFSSGMKQRLKLSLAFYTEANIIFLDEPGTNLDKQAFTWYLEQLHSVEKNKLIFIASNQSNEYPVNAIKMDILDYK